MPLTDSAIRNARPQSKPYKMTDGRGMYLLVNKAGKYLRLPAVANMFFRVSERICAL